MRVVFMGNPEFAIPTVKAIQKSDHELISIVSNESKPIGRGQNLSSTPVGDFAKHQGIHLIEANSLSSKKLKTELLDLKPDIFVVVAFRILPVDLINLPKYGAINLHASLLPKYRGAAPIQWALMNGDTKTGITVFQINHKIDTGKILLQKEMEIFNYDNMFTLGRRLSDAGSNLIIKAMNKIENGDIKSIIQDSEIATFASKITKEMTFIDWRWPSKKIHNWVRGLSPKPGMVTLLNNKRFRIFKTKSLEGVAGKPGTIVNIKPKQILVSTGHGFLSLLEVQLEGKKVLSAEEFLKGNSLSHGVTLGT